MRFTLFLALFISLSSTANAADNTAMKNCSLSAPLPKSGEEANHGQLMLISPRTSELSPNYSGCQTLWFAINGKPIKVSEVEFFNGKPTKFTGFENEQGKISFSCTYKNAKLVNSVGQCDSELPMNIPMASMPSGCFEKVKTGKWPPECEYDGQ
ncbi:MULTISPECIES: hypothetical protein [Shewanella]|uniref:Uncharacterized protein n=1 Tax=Shewanella cutis TaxID=2766780 RepID=A0ABS9QS17_9GAMM|nr:hypothetical protein [Shewanella sp. PS-2]MCG9963140.1 hypothetical protein [Shewanella sp. PS-2]